MMMRFIWPLQRSARRHPITTTIIATSTALVLGWLVREELRSLPRSTLISMAGVMR
jgi:hypothetical protein